MRVRRYPASGCLGGWRARQQLQERRHFFLNGDDGLSLGELLLQAGILTRKSGDFASERVARRSFRARRGRGEGRRPALEALTPLGHLRGIQSIAAKERAAAGIAARIGIILLQDALALSSG